MDERLRRLINLGREHYQAREFDKAERYLSQVVLEHRGSADVWNMLGVIHHDQGRFQQAQEAFEEAVRINPGYTEAALNLAVTYNDLGKYSQAREIYQSAIARSRAEPRSLDPFARGKIANMHADLGAAYAAIGFFAEAVREYQNALGLAPTFVDLRARLANVYRDLGDHPSALRELEACKLQNPRYLPARLGLGVALYSLGRREDAVREWQEVLAMEPGNRAATAYLHMVQTEQPAAAAALGGRQTSASTPDDTDPVELTGIPEGGEDKPR